MLKLLLLAALPAVADDAGGLKRWAQRDVDVFIGALGPAAAELGSDRMGGPLDLSLPAPDSAPKTQDSTFLAAVERTPSWTLEKAAPGTTLSDLDEKAGSEFYLDDPVPPLSLPPAVPTRIKAVKRRSLPPMKGFRSRAISPTRIAPVSGRGF